MSEPSAVNWINGRKIYWLKNEHLQLAVAAGGGHMAAVAPAASDAALDNPLWVPPWPSFEPGVADDALIDRDYGGPPEGRTLASILGHNLCLDLFGAPSPEETAAGVPTHGFFGIADWQWRSAPDGGLQGVCEEPRAQLRVERRIRLEGWLAWVEERVENLSCWDHPLMWQQHVTLGPPWLEAGQFWLETNCDQGRTVAAQLHADSQLAVDAAAAWPMAPARRGGSVDYRHAVSAPRASDFVCFRVRTEEAWGWFLAGHRGRGLALGYLWPRRLYPWLGIWDEKFARTSPPWSGRTYTRGLEFGTSPWPRSRRETFAEPWLLDTPTYLIVPARSSLTAHFALGFLTYSGSAWPRLRVSHEQVELLEGDRSLQTLPWSLPSKA